MKEWLFVLIGAAMVGLGAWGLVKLSRKAQLGRRSHQWPTTPGCVTHSELSDRGEGDWKFLVEYRYEVDGVRHFGEGLQFGRDLYSRIEGKALQERYRPGTDVEVHYDPADPGTAVLRPGGSASLVMPLVAMLVLIGGGVWISLAAVERHQVRQADEAQAQAELPKVPFIDLNAPGGVAVAADGNVYVSDGPPATPSTAGLPALTIGPPAWPGLPTTTAAFPGVPTIPDPTNPRAAAGRVLRMGPDLVAATNVLPRLLTEPNNLAVDGAGKIYIVNGALLWVYTVEHDAGKGETRLSGATPLRGQFSRGVAVDAAGTAFVSTQSSPGRVLRLPAESSTATEIYQAADNGDATDVAVDNASNVYVTDYRNNRVVKIAADGGPIELPFPHLLHPQGIAVDGAGSVYVVDSGNHRVLKWAAGSAAATDLLFDWLVDPYDVAVDSAGNVYVTDRGSHRLLKFPPAVPQ